MVEDRPASPTLPRPPAPARDAEAARDAQAAEAAETAYEAEATWMEGLTKSHSGKKIVDFLGHVTSVLDAGSLSVECPVDQAVSFRRVLIRALERNKTPFGLPKQLPKFIAMVQLNGERMLLTTQINQLFQLFAHAPTGARANSNAVCAMDKMLRYREANPDCTLLLTYSAPFQVDLRSMWWDVRTLRRDPDTLKVVDGELSYQLGQGACRSVACTSALETDSSYSTLDREVRSYEQNVNAVDLDVEFANATALETPTSGNGDVDKRLEAALCMARGLQTERKQLIADHLAEVADLRKQMDAVLMRAADANKAAIEKERERDESINRDIRRLTKECEASIKSVEEVRKENEFLRLSHKSDTHAALLNKSEELEALKKQIVAGESALKLKDQECQRLTRQHETNMKKADAAVQKSLDEMERKLQKATMAERAAKKEAEDFISRLTTLSSAMEGRDSEKELLQHDLKRARTATRVLKGLLVLARVRNEACLRYEAKANTDSTILLSQRFDDLKGKIKLHELAAGASSVETKKLQDLVGDREAERDQLGEANVRLQARIEELEAEAAKAAAAAAEVVEVVEAPEATEKQTADVETMTVPISTEADYKLGELETKCVKLQDDLEAAQQEGMQLKAKLERAKQKLAKGPVPPSLIADDAKSAPAPTPVVGVPDGGNSRYFVNVNVGGAGAPHQTANTELGHASDVDPAVEQLIAQAAGSLRVLADAARESARHKAAACEGWAAARALQNLNGYQMPAQWQMPPQMPPMPMMGPNYL